MAIDVSKLVNDLVILNSIGKTTQEHVKKHPFKVDGIVIELYLHPMELQAELCRLAIRKGRVSMYQLGHGATYRLAWYEEGQYHGISFGYSNVKERISDESAFGHDKALLIPVRIFFNPNKTTYYKTLRSKTNLTDNDILTLLGAGLLQTKPPILEHMEPTYLNELLTFFAGCTVNRANRLHNETERPAIVWKFKSGDIALDLPVPSRYVSTFKNSKASETTIHREQVGDGKYGYSTYEGNTKTYPKSQLGVKAMATSINRAYRNVVNDMHTNVVGIPVIKMFGNEKPALLPALCDRLLEVVTNNPVTRVEQTFKKLDKEVTFENGEMLIQTFNSLKGKCPDVIISSTLDSKIDLILQGARVMKNQVDRDAGEAPFIDKNFPLKIEAYKKREANRTPLTRTEIGNIKYLCSLPPDERKKELQQYTPHEQYTVRNALLLLSKSTHNAYNGYNCSEKKFRQGALNSLNKFSQQLCYAINTSIKNGTLDRVIDDAHGCIDHVDTRFNEENLLSTVLTEKNQLQLVGVKELNSCLTSVIEEEDICGNQKYSKADLEDFFKAMKEGDHDE